MHGVKSLEIKVSVFRVISRSLKHFYIIANRAIWYCRTTLMSGKSWQCEDAVSSELFLGTRRLQRNNTMKYVLNLWASFFWKWFQYEKTSLDQYSESFMPFWQLVLFIMIWSSLLFFSRWLRCSLCLMQKTNSFKSKWNVELKIHPI